MVKKCLVCGKTANEHDRTELQACQKVIEKERTIAQTQLRHQVIAQWLTAEREIEQRGFERGREASRPLVLKYAIKADNIEGDSQPRYRCQECGASWHNWREAHPIGGTCPVEHALIVVK